MSLDEPVVSSWGWRPLSIARILWKDKGKLALLAAGCLVVSGAIVALVPSVYRAQAVILVDVQSIPQQYVSPTVNTEVQDRLMTLSQQILSTSRLEKIIDRFDLYASERRRLAREEVIERMRGDISVELEQGWTNNRPGAFRVAYSGKDPLLVAEVANQIADLFIEENLRAREHQAQGTTDFLQNELAEAKRTLDDLEARVSEYKLAHNGELPQQQAALDSMLSRLQRELDANQDAIHRAEASKITLQDAIRVAETSLQSEIGWRQNQARPGDGNLAFRGGGPKKKSEELQSQYAMLRTRFKPAHPDMVALRDQIEKQKEQEAEDAARAEETSQAARSRPAAPAADPEDDPATAKLVLQERQQVENLRTQVTLADRELAQRQAERAQVISTIKQQEVRMERLPMREQELAGVSRDYEMAKSNYKSLLDKKLAAGLATDMERWQQAERLTMLDEARVPEKPTRPDRPLLYGISALGSLAMAMAFVILADFRRNTLLGAWELPPGTVVLGNIPIIEAEPASTWKGPGKSPGKTPRLVAVSVAAVALAVAASCMAGAYLYFWKS